MRATVVPAQVTTVEDRMTGNLSLGQLILLCAPIFIGGLLYVACVPEMRVTPYKVACIVVSLVVCSVSAIRIKNKIVLFWAIILLRYWTQPRYYVFDKRTLYGRERHESMHVVQEEKMAESPQRIRKDTPLSHEDITRVRQLIANPAANVTFETRKGGLYARITEIKQES